MTCSCGLEDKILKRIKKLEDELKAANTPYPSRYPQFEIEDRIEELKELLK